MIGQTCGEEFGPGPDWSIQARQGLDSQSRCSLQTLSQGSEEKGDAASERLRHSTLDKVVMFTSNSEKYNEMHCVTKCLSH